MASYLEAPENISQSGEMYPEAIIYLTLVKYHPMLLHPKHHAITSGTNSPAFAEDDENSTLSDPEDKTFQSRMTRKTCHSIAAKTHAEGVKCQSQIATIEQALKMGISADILRPFMMKTLHKLFDTNTNNEEEDDNNEEVQFVSSVKRNNSKDKVIKPELILPSSVSGTVDRSRHDSSTVGTSSDGKNELGRWCCADDECVFSDDDVEGNECLQCVNCDKLCHSFCVQPFDDNDPGDGTCRYLFIECVLNSPFFAAEA
jgi:hypothetical protein